MEKIYQPKNVYEAFQERMNFIFSEFDTIYIAFSGGKDSGLLLNLVFQYMRQNGINRKIGVMHQDFEAEYQETASYVERTFSRLGTEENAEPYWLCIPMKVRNAMSATQPWWYPWNKDQKDIWVRPMPESPFVLTEDTAPFFEPGMTDPDTQRKFGMWYRDTHGGKTIALLGVRADESLRRYSAIVNKKYAYKGRMWITNEVKNLYTAFPLYDWRVEDIWAANGKFGFDYNHLYDLYYKAGCTLSDMRVASPFHDWAAASLNLYRIIEPQTWAKVVGRVNGANFGNIYGGTKAMGYKSISLPEGHTWESYTKFLLGTLPADIREHYLRCFRTSIKFWKETGGGFAPEVIQEIKDRGYRIRENGVSNFSKDGKVRIIFDQETPDDTDDVKGTIDIPSWKRMCYCILKNDYMCRFMGFGPTKDEQAKINQIKKKYASVIRGKS